MALFSTGLETSRFLQNTSNHRHVKQFVGGTRQIYVDMPLMKGPKAECIAPFVVFDGERMSRFPSPRTAPSGPVLPCEPLPWAEDEVRGGQPAGPIGEPEQGLGDQQREDTEVECGTIPFCRSRSLRHFSSPSWQNHRFAPGPTGGQ